MADLNSQINAARRDGYSDDEIAAHLGQSDPKLATQIQSAQKDGYSSKEILELLGAAPPPTTAGTGRTGSRLKGEPKPGAFIQPMVAGEKQVEQGVGKLGTGVDPTIGGLSDIFRGSLQMAYPYAAALGLSSIPAVVGTATSIPIGAGAQWGAEALGVPEGTSHAIGDVTGVGGGYLTSKLAGILNPGSAAWVGSKLPAWMLPGGRLTKEGLRAFSHLYDNRPLPVNAPAKYLKHTEPRPGGWSQGVGIGPREAPTDVPQWLRNLRGFTYEDQQNKQGLSGYGKQPPTPQPSPFDAKRTGGFGSTGITGDRTPATPFTLRPSAFKAGNRRGLREDWSDPRGQVLPDPMPEGIYQTRRPPMGPPKTTFSPETLDVEPSLTAPRTYPAATPPPPVPTKRVGGFGRTAVPPQDVQPRETMGPRESEPQDFTPTTIPEPPLPEDIVRGAEREGAAPHEGDTPPAYGTPGYADWFTKTWPNLPLPKGAGGLPPEPITGSTAGSIPPGETRPPGYQPNVGGTLPGQFAPPTLKPENQAVVDKVLQEAGLSPTITPPPGAPVTPPAATEPIVPPAEPAAPIQPAMPGVVLGEEEYWRSLPTIRGQQDYLNKRFHAVGRELDLPGAPEGKNVSGSPTARALYNKGWMDLTPDEMNTVYQFLREHKRLPVPADVESGLYKHPVEPGTAMDNPPPGTVPPAVTSPVTSPASANAMNNPPEPIVPKGGKGKGRRVTIEKPPAPLEPEVVEPPQVTKPVEELKSNAERPAEEPNLPSTDPVDVSANAIYGDDYINLRPNSQMSLRRFYSQQKRYPTIEDVKSGDFKRRGDVPTLDVAEPGAAPEPASDIEAKLQQSIDAANQRMAKRHGTEPSLSANFPAGDVGDMTIWGASKLLKGAVSFSKWSKEMLADAGADAETVRPMLTPEMFAKSQKILEKHIAQAAGNLPSTRKLLEMYSKGESGKDWYLHTRAELEHVFGDDVPIFLDFLAATSQNNTVAGNVTMALKAYMQYKTGKPFDGYMGVVKGNLERIKATGGISGQKVNPFKQNLLGDPISVTVDRWIHRAFGFPGSGPTPAQYKFMDYTLSQLAKERGIEPRQMQAAIWKTIKEAQGKKGNTSASFDEVLRQRIEADPELANAIRRAREMSAGPVGPM